MCSTIGLRVTAVERFEYDLRQSSFEEFVLFLFDKPVPAAGQKEHWYWNVDVLFSPRKVATYYVQLFSDPVFLFSRFNKSELEQAFWAIQSDNLECSVARLIWETEIPFSIRENCVRSMFYLFERLFALDPLDTSVYMWWDSLCYDWNCGNRSRDKGGEDLLMQDVIFETLSKILELPTAHCQDAALHGLGHLHHPKTAELIASFLHRNPNLEEHKKQYALAASRFQVL